MTTKEPKLGEFEQFVLLAILRLGENAYGTTVRQTLKDLVGRDVSIGALYATVERLKEKNLITSKQGDPTPERGGRAKNYLQVTVVGRRLLARSRQNLSIMWDGILLDTP